MIVECERLFDGERLHERMRIVIDGAQIVAVEPVTMPYAGQNDQVIRCRFAMPGLIDSQVHLVGYHEGPPEGRPFEPHTYAMRLLLYAGVTTVRDGGNTLEAIAYLRHWACEHHGPHIVSCGPLLDDLPFTWACARLVQSEEDVRREVTRLAAEGVDFVKAYRNVRASLLTPIVEAAHACNLRVAAHVETATAREACQAGVDSLERLVNAIEPAWTPRHSPELYPGAVGRLRRWAYVDLGSDHVTDFVDLVCAQQVTLVPTLLASRRRVLLDEVINEPYLDYMVAVMPYHRFFKGMRNAVGYAIGKRFLNRHIPFPHLDKAAQHEIDQGWQRLRQLMRLLHQRGARMVPGSDSPTPSVVPGFGLHQELREWVACGIPPLAVLAAATAHAADFLGLERVGRIRPGASADLLLVDGDPDCAIEALAAPDNQVICRGQRIDRAALKAAIMARVKELE